MDTTTDSANVIAGSNDAGLRAEIEEAFAELGVEKAPPKPSPLFLIVQTTAQVSSACRRSGRLLDRRNPWAAYSIVLHDGSLLSPEAAAAEPGIPGELLELLDKLNAAGAGDDDKRVAVAKVDHRLVCGVGRRCIAAAEVENDKPMTIGGPPRPTIEIYQTKEIVVPVGRYGAVLGHRAGTVKQAISVAATERLAPRLSAVLRAHYGTPAPRALLTPSEREAAARAERARQWNAETIERELRQKQRAADQARRREEAVERIAGIISRKHGTTTAEDLDRAKRLVQELGIVLGVQVTPPAEEDAAAVARQLPAIPTDNEI